MPSGTIARLLIDKGFGFIRDESGIEHFFHRMAHVADRTVRGLAAGVAVVALKRRGAVLADGRRGVL